MAKDSLTLTVAGTGIITVNYVLRLYFTSNSRAIDDYTILFNSIWYRPLLPEFKSAHVTLRQNISGAEQMCAKVNVKVKVCLIPMLSMLQAECSLHSATMPHVFFMISVITRK